MRVLIEREAEDFLEKEGFPVAKRFIASNLKEAVDFADKLKYPVTMKVVSKQILHKSDVGGVKLDIRNKEEVKKHFQELSKLKGFEGVLMQKFREGRFILIGLKEDQTFGHAIAFGTGGIYTEVLKDVSFRVCPINDKDAESMIQETKAYEILKGARGYKPVNLNTIKKLLVKFSKLPSKYPKIKELDVNPLLVTDSTEEIIDARIIFA